VKAIVNAEILAVGTELTTGGTRDTNSGQLARDLTMLGVHVLSATALPDHLDAVRDAFAEGLRRADLIVSTGGLGPTPDDLTREAIAAALGAKPRVDAAQLALLAGLFERRGMAMPESNLKQAWLIKGAEALPNGHGTAPGWFVEAPDERLIVALPGPPREMWPMWREQALPRLELRGLGVGRATHTLRLTGIGESALVALIGEDVLRASSPEVATYARPDAVDVVIRASSGDRSAAERTVAATVSLLRETLSDYVFAEGDETWADALAAVLHGRTLATVEIGTGGQLLALLGTAPFFAFGELLAAQSEIAHAATSLGHYAQRVREVGHADIGLAVFARQTRDTHLRIAIASGDDMQEMQRTAFMAGNEGRRRAALAACATLWGWLRKAESG
jgi:nicotinamide-nucleotide amidase